MQTRDGIFFLFLVTKSEVRATKKVSGMEDVRRETWDVRRETWDLKLKT